jgi:NAD(P)-dependent dehydrogenase (short-subunit alcohol dehydrogenase family)
LEGKVSLVTGGSSGIGRASALAFAREGAKVVVADVNVAGGEETVSMIKKASGEAIFVKADVANAIEVEALINKAIKTYGRLDCAHNNAGIGVAPGIYLADYAEENWDLVINVNLKGVWLCMKYEIPYMIKQKSGAIVNTASTFSLVASPGLSAYIASKAGVAGLTRAAALEYASAGIRVNAVGPGPINTPLLQQAAALDPKGLAVWRAQIPLGRIGNPEEVANAVVWLCSGAASFVTGLVMIVDGGVTAQ